MLPQYRGRRDDDDDPKIHRQHTHPIAIPSLSVINSVLIAIGFVLIIGLGSRHYHVTQQAVKHHLGTLQMRKDTRTPLSYTFVLTDAVDHFVRYPSDSFIPQMRFEHVIRYRTCCHVDGTDTHYVVCDYGQGATVNLGIECLVHSDNRHDAYMEVWVPHANMAGAQCTLHWWEKETDKHGKTEESTKKKDNNEQ